MTLSHSTTTLFTAFQPDAAFDAKLRALKDRVLSIVGPQLYLNHPPHLTLYLASFPSENEVAAETERWVSETTPLQLVVVRWHVFRGDALTGNHSLVCELHPKDEVNLREHQAELIRRIAPLRDVAASTQRFEASRGRLSPQEWRSVQDCGFPYVGSLWRPHFTVASIRPADWEIVWDELKELAPTGPVACPKIGLYRLCEEHPKEIAIFQLRERP